MTSPRLTAPLTLARARGGFTLVEVLVATALLGFSLVVMFGFHSQAVRSNLNARKITDCTYLAQQQLEHLMALSWTQAAGRPADLVSNTGSGTGDWDPLYHPASGALPTPINATGEIEGAESDGQPRATYYVTWDVIDMNATSSDWVRVRVRCAWQDSQFASWTGTTVSTYRFLDG